MYEPTMNTNYGYRINVKKLNYFLSEDF